MKPRMQVGLTEDEIRALLALCPRCRGCGARAELMLNGSAVCVPCAAKIKSGKAETPTWSNAADVLETALSPFEVKR